jgi:WD40 repeat protein
MRWRQWAGLLLLALLISSSLVGTVEAQTSTEFLGRVREYSPGDLEPKASDLAADSDRGQAIVTRGDEGVIVWDLETGEAVQVVIPSRAWAVTVEITQDWLMVCDVTGRVHGVNPVQGRISWSKTILSGTLRASAVTDDELRMALAGTNDELEMVIAVVTLPEVSKWPSWSDNIPDEMAFLTPTALTWISQPVVSGWTGDTLMVGTNEGSIYSWRGNGAFEHIVDLDSEVVGMEFDRHTGRLIAATNKGVIYSIDVARYQVSSQFTTEFRDTRSLVSFDLHNQKMVVGGSDGQMEIWDMALKVRTQTIRYHNYTLADAAWAGYQQLVSAGRYARMALWGPDGDEDGHADVNDAFPTDPTEWADSDKDGRGDNIDMFPDDPTEYWDTDADGVGDQSDLFPKDPTEWADGDGDGVGDNGDFIPNMHNVLAAGLFVAVVGMAAAVPVARMAHLKRRGRRKRREVVRAWVNELGVKPVAEMGTPEGRVRLDRTYDAYRVRENANPPLLRETVEAYDTTVLNTIVALRVQEEIAERGGVGADAAMSRSVNLRDQLQELDGERERLDAICKSYWKVQDQLDKETFDLWPGLEGLEIAVNEYKKRVDMLDNSLQQFRKGSIIKIGDDAAKISRGAYVVATKEIRVRGSERPLAVKVGVPPRPEVIVPEPDERGEDTPLSVTPPLGRLRTRQAMLVRDDTADLVVSVDNTLAEDLEELAVEFSIAGDRLRHKGPHKVELGNLVTGRTAAATFQMRIVPPPPADEDPGELTRILARVTGKVGSRRVRHELPAKVTTLVSAGLTRPSGWGWKAMGKTVVGCRGVRFPRVPSKAVTTALEFPHGMLPVMNGSLEGGGVWTLYASNTEEEEPLAALVAVETGPEWVDLLVEVRGPPRFPSRELAEELIDSVRYAILNDKRLRLRGEDKPMGPERVKELSRLMAEAYIGHPDADLSEANMNGGEA